MIIDYFDVLSAIVSPSKTNSVLIVYPDTILAFSIAFKGFQTIPGWNAKIIQPTRDLYLTKLSTGNRGKIGKTPYRITLGKGFSIRTPKGLYHGITITHCVNNVKRFYA
jgi:hypothetical protein